MFPIGVSLVPPSTADSRSSSAKLSSGGNSGLSGVKAGTDGSNTDVKKSTKPKWFSLK